MDKILHQCQGCEEKTTDLKIAKMKDDKNTKGSFWLCPDCREESPSFPKEHPFYCCQCQQNTDGLSTCHDCGHMKGRWKTDKHHCIRPDWEGMQKNLQEQIASRK